MKHKLLFAALALVSISLGSCKDDDEEDKRSDDPRILKMTLSEFPEATFIVNDYKGVIYNYDSLPYGSPTNLHPYFVGHSALTVFYDSLGNWAAYSNSDTDLKLNCNSGMVRALSEDQSAFKDYKIELRVHRYDVDAFVWAESAKVPVKDGVTSFKTLKIGDEIVFVCTAAGSNFAYTTKDAKSWTEKSVSVEAGKVLDWKTLCVSGNKAYVLSDNSDVLAAELPALDFKATGLKAEEILFNIDGNIWTIAEIDGSRALCSIDTVQNTLINAASLPETFPSEHIKATACKSGQSTLGYVYGIKDNASCLWAIDTKGKVTEIVNAGSSLPLLKGFEFCFFQSNLGMVGGIDEDGVFSKKYYYTKNSGLDWIHDWHKDLPDEMGQISDFNIINISDDEILLSCGIADGVFTPAVWKGTIKEKLLKSDD